MRSDVGYVFDPSDVSWFETIPCAVIVSDSEGRIQAANDVAERLFGYPAGTLVGAAVEALVPGPSRPGHAIRRAALATDPHHRMGGGRVLQALRKDGSIFPAEISLVPLQQRGWIAAFVVDVSLRSDAITRYRTLFDKASDAIVVVSEHGVVIDANDNACLLFDMPRDRVTGRRFDEFIDSAAGEAVFDGILARGGTLRRDDVPLRLERGKLVHVELSAVVVPLDAERVVFVLLRDVSAQLELQAQLRAADKMASIGTLATGIAHDFNNMLSVILSYASLVLDDLPPGSSLREDVQEIRNAGERASHLTRQLLAFSRRQALQPRTLDLNEIVANLEAMVRRLVGDDIAVEIIVSPALHAVRGDPGQLEQVLMNLVVNARDAMPHGGKLTIETANVEPEAGGVAHVLLAVTDTGTGMDEATRQRIFEPFFTTKEKGRGTGLGLSTVFGIVQQSDGFITVRSEPGRGTRFEIHLPAMQPAAGNTTSSRTLPPASGRGTETILIVEDDSQVRAVARGILRRNGYTVLDAANGGEALLVCERHQGDIHLLLTDMNLPLMSGTDLAARLSALRPAMRVLVMSGYGESSPTIAYLEKPLRPEVLVRKVRRVLDE